MKTAHTLIHVALPVEAKALRKYLQMKPLGRNLYTKDKILLAISGMGDELTFKTLKPLFEQFLITKALNFGMAGCQDKNIPIGTLCCSTHKLEDVFHATISSVTKPLKNLETLETTLVDMESKAFKSCCDLFIDKEKIYIFKVVSDYGTDKIPTKEFVGAILTPHIKKVLFYVFN
ncbi:MAG: hypothetical protein GX780_05520 [Campylobacteraceae bacterium]|nr:hypothetical protein [Campylobacteraceae bacterium]